MKGLLLNKGEKYYTYLGKIFAGLNNFQKEYNWLITDFECYGQKIGRKIENYNGENYIWITGEELTDIIMEEDFQWIWAVLSGFEKNITWEEVKKYTFPYADGYRGFWSENISIQHPFAAIELVAFDSSFTLFISKKDELVDKFRKVFPLSVDLEKYNKGLLDDSSEYEQWLENH